MDQRRTATDEGTELAKLTAIGLDPQVARSSGRLLKLEALRGFAALYILFGHFGNNILNHPRWGVPLRFGTEAVGLFFLISGFVIYYSTFAQSNQMVARDYFVKRARRIYPLFLVSMAVSYSFISLAGREALPLDLKNLVGNVLMLQDYEGGRPGVWFHPYYNAVYWSLSYEWWYYILFFFVVRLIADADKRQYIVFISAIVGLAATLVFPNEPALFLKAFMSWWCGVELAREYCRSGTISWNGQRQTIALLAVMAAASFLPVLIEILHHRPLGLGGYPTNDFRLVFSSLVFVVGGVLWARRQFIGFSWTFGWFVIVAPISYGIYIFHLPILILLDSQWRGWPRIFELLALLAVTFLIAYVFEVRVQRIINRWTKEHLLSSKRPAYRKPPSPKEADAMKNDDARASALSRSPGIPGEGWGEGSTQRETPRK